MNNVHQSLAHSNISMDQFIGNSSCHPPKESKIGNRGFSGNFQVGEKQSQPRGQPGEREGPIKNQKETRVHRGQQGIQRKTITTVENLSPAFFFQGRSWLHRFT